MIFKLELESESLVLSKTNNIVGKVYFSFKNDCFPERGWNDFVPVVLHWWLPSAGEIYSNNSDYEKLVFMDGPFYVEVNSVNGEMCGIKFFHERNEVGSIEISKKIFFTEIFNAAKSFLEVCESKRWLSSEITQLQEQLNVCKTHMVLI